MPTMSFAMVTGMLVGFVVWMPLYVVRKVLCLKPFNFEGEYICPEVQLGIVWVCIFIVRMYIAHG